MKIQKPSKGRVVLFTVAKSKATDPSETELCEHTAVITDPSPSEDRRLGVVDLVVFNDEAQIIAWEVSRMHSLTPKPGTWRYPPRVEGEIEVSE